MATTYSSIKDILNNSFKNFWLVLKSKIDDISKRITDVDEKHTSYYTETNNKIDAITSKLTNYKLLSATTVSIACDSIDAGKNKDNVTATFTKDANAILCIPVLRNFSWLTPTYAHIDGNTLSVNFLNTTTASHSSKTAYIILQFGEL